MDFAFDAKTEELRTKLLAFMDEHVYPAEAVLEQQLHDAADPWERQPVLQGLKDEARRQGLWNLFHPEHSDAPWPRPGTSTACRRSSRSSRPRPTRAVCGTSSCRTPTTRATV